jgi:ADP-dependent phosphofructokinase/glucokinase
MASWQAAYLGVQQRISLHARQGRWTLCGFSACVDAFTRLDDACHATLRAGPPEAQALAVELSRRAALGIGGEIRVDWPEGSAWLDAHLPLRLALGGTSAHAARLLTLIGAPALLALEHRSPEQLAVLDADMLIAAEAPVRAADERGGGVDRPRVYVFEYDADEPIDGAAPPRASRIIIRFHDFDLERDEAFLSLGPRLLRQGGGQGCGVLSGFNALGAGARLEAGLALAREAAAAWRAAGIGLIHLELAGYESPACRDRAIAGLTGAAHSLGMSLSEFRALMPGSGPLADGLIRLGERFSLDRVTVHADDWAISATRRNPAQEREALMMGCLLASARAAAGQLTIPSGLPPGACFEEPPPEVLLGDWSIISCPSPHVRHPRTTLGLGDTFMAGCLLVLGQPSLPAAAHAALLPPPRGAARGAATFSQPS